MSPVTIPSEASNMPTATPSPAASVLPPPSPIVLRYNRE